MKNNDKMSTKKDINMKNDNYKQSFLAIYDELSQIKDLQDEKEQLDRYEKLINMLLEKEDTLSYKISIVFKYLTDYFNCSGYSRELEFDSIEDYLNHSDSRLNIPRSTAYDILNKSKIYYYTAPKYLGTIEDVIKKKKWSMLNLIKKYVNHHTHHLPIFYKNFFAMSYREFELWADPEKKPYVKKYMTELQKRIIYFMDKYETYYVKIFPLQTHEDIEIFVIEYENFMNLNEEDIA
ncbi:MAG: hypothetical protein GF317_20030 [Candidatus Lokiarchaeota archaeon]|nr:hypothetical protein [Candidatus Lokiarchaeota archaeon]